MTTSDVDRMVRIEGDLDVIDNSDASLVIILPRDVELETLYLEVGASEVNICDVDAADFYFDVGAGQANLSNVFVSRFDLEVGAGEAVVKNLSANKVDVEVGVGKVDIEIAGAEPEYSYAVECGIGDVTVGTRSFGGMGGKQSVTNLYATKEINVDCGIGSVEMYFMCDISDGTCEDPSHNHSDYNRHNNDHE